MQPIFFTFFSQDWEEQASHRRVCNGQQNLWKSNVSSVAASLTDMIISIKRRWLRCCNWEVMEFTVVWNEKSAGGVCPGDGGGVTLRLQRHQTPSLQVKHPNVQYLQTETIQQIWTLSFILLCCELIFPVWGWMASAEAVASNSWLVEIITDLSGHSGGWTRAM